jgi:hypothetical protein
VEDEEEEEEDEGVEEEEDEPVAALARERMDEGDHTDSAERDTRDSTRLEWSPTRDNIDDDMTTSTRRVG